MDLITLQKANDLKKDIEEVRKQKGYWVRATNINSLHLNEPNSYNYVNTDFVNFDILQMLTLLEINKRLDALVNEFENLKPAE